MPLLDRQRGDIGGREHRRDSRGAGAVAGEQGCAVRAHAAGDVGAHGVHARELLERAQGRVGHEGAALDDHLRADLLGITQLDDLEQGVLDHGVGQARRDVAHRGALLLRLLDARVHEHGAAAAQVDGVLRRDGLGRERAHVHIHRHGEALDEATAARGAGLVEHDVLDHAVAHAQALHVLAADVEDELDAGEEGAGAAQMGDGLDLARVGLEGLDEQGLAVTGGGHVADGATSRDMRVEVRHDGLGGTQNVAVVVTVPGVQELTILTHHRGLHRGGAGVEADEHAPGVALKLAAGHDLARVTLPELGEVGLGREQRIQAGDLVTLGVAQRVDGVDELAEPHELARLMCHGRAGGHEQMGVVGHDDVLVVEVEREVEAMT